MTAGTERRFSPETRPALVLSGGALLGALQAGVLKTLFRAGFQPSMVVGTSVGAINGAFVAFHPNAAAIERLEVVWCELRASRVFDENPFRMAFGLLGQTNALFGNGRLRELVEAGLPVDDFSAAAVPLFITSTNLSTGEKVVLSSGPVSDAVLASAAVPGVFAPYQTDAGLLVDGGLAANLDIETAVDQGADEVLAIDLTQPPTVFHSRNIVEVLNRSLEVMLRHQVLRDIDHFADRARITVIRPRLEHEHTLASISHIPHLIEEGERLGEELLAKCLDEDGRLSCQLVTN